MKIFKNKGFKAFIITKKGIAVFISAVLLISSAISTAIIEKKNNERKNLYTDADDIYGIILSSQLHDQSDIKENAKNFFKKLIGFDIEDPKTILHEYSPQFTETKNHIDPKDVVLPSPTPAPTPQPTPEQKPIEEINSAKGLSVSNATKIQIFPEQLIKEALSFSLDNDGPQILIVHTHTTESYTDSSENKYSVSSTDRSTDETKNMIAVGNALCDALEEKGISVVHDTTVHDYPAYNGSYDRCKATILSNLKKYPSIKMVLDVHRDGIMRSDDTKIKVACDIAGAKSAQCMFVVGSNANLSHDNWQENLKLALKLQNKANEIYPGLMRAVNLREERFNQQLSKGSLIIEIGSNGNNLNEAIYGAKLMGNVIAKVFE